MSVEGGRDRPGNNRRNNLLMDICWNEFTGKSCEKRRYINKTGVASVYGSVVRFSTTDDYGIVLSVANDDEAIGSIYEAGVADGSECWIVTRGSAEVLLEDTKSVANGDWIETAATPGRIDAHAAPNPATHWQELGHGVKAVIGGTDILAEIEMHQN